MKTIRNIIQFEPSVESFVPLSPLAELLHDARYFSDATFCSVSEQVEILETTAWFRERGDDLSKHRASQMQVVSDRRAALIIGGWIETRTLLEGLKSAVLRALDSGAPDLEAEKAIVLAWTPDQPAARLIAACWAINSAIGSACGPKRFSAAFAAKDDRVTAEVRANPARYGSDMEFLVKLREICIPAA